MYTLTYIYTFLYQIKQSVFLSNVFVNESEINLLNKFSIS